MFQNQKAFDQIELIRKKEQAFTCLSEAAFSLSAQSQGGSTLAHLIPTGPGGNEGEEV